MCLDIIVSTAYLPRQKMPPELGVEACLEKSVSETQVPNKI